MQASTDEARSLGPALDALHRADSMVICPEKLATGTKAMYL